MIRNPLPEESMCLGLQRHSRLRFGHGDVVFVRYRLSLTIWPFNYQKPEQMSDNKACQLLESFTCHGFYTITGKYQEQSVILPVSVNMAFLRTVIIVRIPESGNRNPTEPMVIDDYAKDGGPWVYASCPWVVDRRGLVLVVYASCPWVVNGRGLVLVSPVIFWCWWCGFSAVSLGALELTWNVSNVVVSGLVLMLDCP